MSTRYLTNMATALLAGFVVVVSFAFTAAAGAWIAFGVAIGILTIAVLAQAESRRGRHQRAIDGLVGALAIATIVTTLVYAAPVLAWLFFAEALGLVGLSVAGLTLYEIERWRAEHGMAELHALRPELHVLHRRPGTRRSEAGGLAA